jgi:hypothetical protein
MQRVGGCAAQNVEIFPRPASAPEHKPDEYLNHDLKQTIKN